MFEQSSELYRIGRSCFSVAMLVFWVTVFVPETVVAQETTQSNRAPAFKVSGKVLKSSGKYDVYVILWNANDFLEKPIQEICIKPGDNLNYELKVPEGRWVVGAFEDNNGNGILDMGFFGPKEPIGFWREFSAWRKPRFEEVSRVIGKVTAGADVKLK